MRKLTHLFLIAVSFVNLGKVHAMTEFIFAANVPVYVPFESDLLKSVSELESGSHLNAKARARIETEISEKFSALAYEELGYIGYKSENYSSSGRTIKNPALKDPDLKDPSSTDSDTNNLISSKKKAPVRKKKVPARKKQDSNLEYYDSDLEFEIDKNTSPNWRGAYKLYDLEKERPKNLSYNLKKKIVEPLSSLNRNKDIARVSRVVDLFEKESFGNTDEESKDEFKKRVCLAILANRPKSVLSVQNASLKEEDDDSRAVVIKGAWSPKWMVRRNKHNEFEDVSHNEVRRYVRYCLDKWKKADKLAFVANTKSKKAAFEEKRKWQDKVIAILKQEYKVSEHVPYRELREALRISQERVSRLKRLVRGRDCFIFEATHDSDLLGLRVQTDNSQSPELGLYSYYTLVLQRKFHENNPLDILTTGYRAVYEEARYLKKAGGVKKEARKYYAWVYQAIEADRYARAAASKVDFRASYISEPNALFFVPKGKNWPILPYSFLGEGKDKATMGEINKYYPRESLVILKQIYQKRPNARILFDPRHPVWMSVPDRMLEYKNKSAPCFNLQNYGEYSYSQDSFDAEKERVLTFARNISQTPFSSRDYAIMLYAQLGLSGNEFFISLPNSRKKSDKSKEYHPDALFKNCVKIMFDYYWEPEKLKENKIRSHTIKNVDELAIFMNKVFEDSVGDIVKAIAQSIISSYNEHYEVFFNGSNSASRTSARSSMERSPQREGDEALDLQPMTSGSARLNRRAFSNRSPSPEPRTPW